MVRLPTVSVWYLVGLWYLSACVAVTSSRAVLVHTHMPFCLSALQFILSATLSYSLLKWGLPWATKGSYKPLLDTMPADSPEFKLVRSISLTYTLGFVFTNIALGLCNGACRGKFALLSIMDRLSLFSLFRRGAIICCRSSIIC